MTKRNILYIHTLHLALTPRSREEPFCDIKGQTYALKTLSADKLLLLHHSPVLEQAVA